MIFWVIEGIVGIKFWLDSFKWVYWEVRLERVEYGFKLWGWIIADSKQVLNHVYKSKDDTRWFKEIKNMEDGRIGGNIIGQKDICDDSKLQEFPGQRE